MFSHFRSGQSESIKSKNIDMHPCCLWKSH